MKKSNVKTTLAALALAFMFSDSLQAATANIKITEWMYNASGTAGIGEFVEFTNLGAEAVNMTGWSFDDNSRTAGSQSLTAFGQINPGESVILTDALETDFRASWNLTASVKVIGGNTNNLGRSDEINLYDQTGTLVDELTYNDQGTGTVKGPRTQGTSGRPSSLLAIGANTASAWVLSTVGDVEGSYLSLAAGAMAAGDLGNPGKTSFAPTAVPIPAAVWLFLSALTGFGILGRRK